MRREGIVSTEERVVDGVTFEVVLDDIGYFVKREGKPIRSFHRKNPDETDLRQLIPA